MPKPDTISSEDRAWKKWFDRSVRSHVHKACPQCGAAPFRPCINQVMAMGVKRDRKNSRAPSRARYRAYIHAARRKADA